MNHSRGQNSKFVLMLQAIQCLGGNGYVNEYPTGRLLRDAKLYEIGAGTSEIRRMIIGRELFKQD
jgi:isovaleryl-CoA dehydrogenase